VRIVHDGDFHLIGRTRVIHGLGQRRHHVLADAALPSDRGVASTAGRSSRPTPEGGWRRQRR
jgi:hypothetical protein